MEANSVTNAYYRLYGRYYNRDDSNVAGTDDDAADHSWGGQGYRVDWKPTDDNLVTVQGDGFVYRGDDLFGTPRLVAPFRVVQHLNRRVEGGNIVGTWTHFDDDGQDFKLLSYYDYVHETLTLDERARDVVHQFAVEFDHRFCWGETKSLQSSMNWRQWEFDTTLRYVDRLPASGVASYVVMDVRLAWKPSYNWEIAVVGQNLLHDQHDEIRTTIIDIQQTAVEQSVYGKVTWRY